MLGSHNSLSYLKPRQWWLRPLSWTAKCQDLDISRQWDVGVRYFDVRVRFRGNTAISAHGIFDYEIPLRSVFSLLDSRARDEECVVRLMLEKKGNSEDLFFRSFVEIVKRKYPNLIFVGGLRKDPFEEIATVHHVPERHCYQLFQDYEAKTLWQKLKGLKFPFPWYYAKKNNRKYREGMTDSCYTILDFVELN